MYEVPLAVYSELSDEERSATIRVLRRVAGIVKSENKMRSICPMCQIASAVPFQNDLSTKIPASDAVCSFLNMLNNRIN